MRGKGLGGSKGFSVCQLIVIFGSAVFLHIIFFSFVTVLRCNAETEIVTLQQGQADKCICESGNHLSTLILYQNNAQNKVDTLQMCPDAFIEIITRGKPIFSKGTPRYECKKPEATRVWRRSGHTVTYLCHHPECAPHSFLEGIVKGACKHCGQREGSPDHECAPVEDGFDYDSIASLIIDKFWNDTLPWLKGKPAPEPEQWLCRLDCDCTIYLTGHGHTHTCTHPFCKPKPEPCKPAPTADTTINCYEVTVNKTDSIVDGWGNGKLIRYPIEVDKCDTVICRGK